MQTFSKSVFRQEHRLAVAVMARAAQPQELYAQAIAEKLGLAQPEVTKHLRDLEEAGLLTKRTQRGPTSRKGGRPGALYARTEDEFWNCLAGLGERFRRPGPKGESPTSGQ